MSDYETTADLNESIYYDRLDVDLEQARLEAEGNAHWRRVKRVEALLAEGRREEAVAACPHGGGYDLSGAFTGIPSPAAQDAGDPRAGERGFRCGTCGAHLTDIMGDVLNLY
jgi:hypothetical protein